MSYGTRLLIGSIIVFCVVFPAAQVTHIFTGQFAATPQRIQRAPSPTPTICQQEVNSDTVDYTVCGGITTYFGDQLRVAFGQVGYNINENLALVGIGRSNDVVSNSMPTPAIATIIINTFPYGLIYGAGFDTLANPPLATQVVRTPYIATAIATAVLSTTPQKLVTLTATSGRRTLDTATPVATAVVLPTTIPTSEPTAAPAPEPEPTSSLPLEATVAPTTLLPRNILDGFRARMPPKGFWQGSTDGVYVAVGSFRFLPSYFGADAPEKQKFVTLSVTVKNTRAPGSLSIYVDRTNFTVTDLDGKTTSILLNSDDLTLPMQATELAPGESVGGQLVFLIGKYSAPAQITVSVANMDTYLTRVDQAIELRVWPIVQ